MYAEIYCIDEYHESLLNLEIKITGGQPCNPYSWSLLEYLVNSITNNLEYVVYVEV